MSSVLNFIMGVLVGGIYLGRYFYRDSRCGVCLNCHSADKHMPCERATQSPAKGQIEGRTPHVK